MAVGNADDTPMTRPESPYLPSVSVHTMPSTASQPPPYSAAAASESTADLTSTLPAKEEAKTSDAIAGCVVVVVLIAMVTAVIVLAFSRTDDFAYFVETACKYEVEKLKSSSIQTCTARNADKWIKPIVDGVLLGVLALFAIFVCLGACLQPQMNKTILKCAREIEMESLSRAPRPSAEEIV